MMFGIETIYALILFGTLILLLKGKRFLQRRHTGLDPEVMGKSEEPLQRYFYRFIQLLYAAGAGLVVAHGAGLRETWGFQRLAALDAPPVDHVGFAVGVSGLLVCVLAQWTMGASWRVGIDQQGAAKLVTTGIFGIIRNPTYLGMFLFNCGLWLIWPTPAMALFGVMYSFFLEVQVRCEEKFLTEAYGQAYRKYQRRTTRYFPWIY